MKSKLNEIVKRCGSWQTWTSNPTRFRATLPDSVIIFNDEVEVDLMWIDSDPVLCIIDRGTRYSVVKFLHAKTAEHIWEVIINCE